MATIDMGGLDPLTGLKKTKTPASYPPYVVNPPAAGGTPARPSPLVAVVPSDYTSGGGGNGAGANPFAQFDYKQAILNDPGYLQSIGQINAGVTADRASLTAARQRAIAAFGFVPDYSGADAGLLGPDFASDLTPEVRALAQQNTAAHLSTQARLEDAHTQAKRALVNSLARTGALHSGEAGYQLGLDQTQFQQGQYDANQKLLDALGGFSGTYTQQVQAAEMAKQQAAAQAAQNALLQALLSAQAYGGGGGYSTPAAPSPPAPPSAPGPYQGQTYTVPNPGFTPQDVSNYRYSNPYNPNR